MDLCDKSFLRFSFLRNFSMKSVVVFEEVCKECLRILKESEEKNSTEKIKVIKHFYLILFLVSYFICDVSQKAIWEKDNSKNNICLAFVP